MTLRSCTEPAPEAAEISNPGQPRDAGPDAQFVGRTSVPAAGRALVPTAASPLSDTPAAARPASATFLAQLIATAQHAPQTRARRRAEPDQARAVYDAVARSRTDVRCQMSDVTDQRI
jgi:hypothetical protein